MENNQNDYHVSFFKPVTPEARKNRNMVIWLVIIWATAVFGFQILLRLIEKPVPEPAYTSFMSVWNNVSNETANNDELKTFANSVLTVLGKVYVKPDLNTALTNAFTWAVFKISDEETSESISLKLEAFLFAQENSKDILDEVYVNAKNTLGDDVALLLGLEANDARRMIIPFSLKKEFKDIYSQDNKDLTAKAMPLYLIHNRSVLTDTKFLGFPFHYFYTAVFLLTLFIALCWAYCKITDIREAKEQIV